MLASTSASDTDPPADMQGGERAWSIHDLDFRVMPTWAARSLALAISQSRVHIIRRRRPRMRARTAIAIASTRPARDSRVRSPGRETAQLVGCASRARSRRSGSAHTQMPQGTSVRNRSEPAIIATPRGPVQVVRQEMRGLRRGSGWTWFWLARRKGKVDWSRRRPLRRQSVGRILPAIQSGSVVGRRALRLLATACIIEEVRSRRATPPRAHCLRIPSAVVRSATSACMWCGGMTVTGSGSNVR